MSATNFDLAIFDSAVRAFWTGRELQQQKQIDSGRKDAGTRGAVTGGQHLGPLQEAVADVFHSNPDLAIEVRSKGRLTLPGYYRRNKDWDIVALYRGIIVGAVEFKSQVGSFSNNFNNRTEETIGSAVDNWRSHEEGYLGPIRPWIGYVMVLQKHHDSTKILRNGKSLYPTDPIFNDTSYLDRYRILLQRLVREGKYDAAVVVATETGGGIFDEPIIELSFANLVAAIRGRLEYIKNLPDEVFKQLPPLLDIN